MVNKFSKNVTKSIDNLNELQERVEILEQSSSATTNDLESSVLFSCDSSFINNEKELTTDEKNVVKYVLNFYHGEDNTHNEMHYQLKPIYYFKYENEIKPFVIEESRFSKNTNNFTQYYYARCIDFNFLYEISICVSGTGTNANNVVVQLQEF